MFDTSFAAAVKKPKPKKHQRVRAHGAGCGKSLQTNQNSICHNIKAPLPCFSHGAFKSDDLDDLGPAEPRVKRCVYLSRR